MLGGGWREGGVDNSPWLYALTVQIMGTMRTSTRPSGARERKSWRGKMRSSSRWRRASCLVCPLVIQTPVGMCPCVHAWREVVEVQDITFDNRTTTTVSIGSS